jgi:hypothetical protein
MATFHGTLEWKRARRVARIQAKYTCARCHAYLPGKGQLHVHHRKPVARSMALSLEPLNFMVLCSPCHNIVEPRVTNTAEKASRARPILPKPGCRVMLVCGPVAAGKSSYVKANRGPDDTVVDFDAIARDLGYGRERRSLSRGKLGLVLQERNRRLRALAQAPRDHVAWVILLAPSSALRAWWIKQLNVAPDDMVLLTPSKEDLKKRILSDPTRAKVIDLHMQLMSQWFDKERANDPGFVSGACDINGNPIDSLHPWLSKPGGHS